MRQGGDCGQRGLPNSALVRRLGSLKGETGKGSGQVTSRTFPQVMGAAEIGRLLGVSRHRVRQLVKTPGFSAPVAVLDMGKVWRAEDIHKWVAERR